MADSNRISPTAHYTSWVWYRNGLSPKALATPTGRLLFAASAPFNFVASRRLGGLTLERMLLQRHHVIDYLLERALEGGARQVLELACGLSGRGVRSMGRHADLGLRYIEADLPAMAADKRALLRDAGLLRPGHEVVDVDVLVQGGPLCLEALAAEHLDEAAPTVVITEGLIDYFAPTEVIGLWTRLAALFRPGGGVYLSDINLTEDTPRSALSSLFFQVLERSTGGRLSQRFDDARTAAAELERAGFAQATLHDLSDFYDVIAIPRLTRPPVTRVIEARFS